jgi:hypothetical protein
MIRHLCISLWPMLRRRSGANGLHVTSFLICRCGSKFGSVLQQVEALLHAHSNVLRPHPCEQTLVSNQYPATRAGARIPHPSRDLGGGGAHGGAARGGRHPAVRHPHLRGSLQIPGTRPGTFRPHHALSAFKLCQRLWSFRNKGG